MRNDAKDSELIAACLQKDGKAWEILVRRYRRLVFSIPIKWGLKHEDAMEVFQGVWLDCFRQLHSLRDLDRLQPWLTRITVRKCFRFSQAKRAQAEVSIDENDEKFAGDPSPELIRRLDQELDRVGHAARADEIDAVHPHEPELLGHDRRELPGAAEQRLLGRHQDAATIAEAGRAEPGVDRRHHLHPNQRGLAVSGCGDRPVQPPGGGLVDATGDAQQSGHRCTGDGLVAASPTRGRGAIRIQHEEDVDVGRVVQLIRAMFSHGDDAEPR